MWFACICARAPAIGFRVDMNENECIWIYTVWAANSNQHCLADKLHCNCGHYNARHKRFSLKMCKIICIKVQCLVMVKRHSSHHNTPACIIYENIAIYIAHMAMYQFSHLLFACESWYNDNRQQHAAMGWSETCKEIQLFCDSGDHSRSKFGIVKKNQYEYRGDEPCEFRFLINSA